MEAALLGFSGSGVSTVFDAVAGPGRATVGLSGGRGKMATIPVPDPRLERLSALWKPKKTTPTSLRLRDIPGLPRGGGAAAATLLGSGREVDCVVYVVGAFAGGDVEKTLATERAALLQECHMADLALLETRLDRKRKAAGKQGPTRLADAEEVKLLEPIVAALGDGKALREVAVPPLLLPAFKETGLLGIKTVLWIENVTEDALGKGKPAADTVRIAARLEREAAELEPAERGELLGLYGITELVGPRLLRAIYQALGCLSFFTMGEDEVRAWTLTAGQNAVDAARAIHTDLAEGFVRAKICTFADTDASNEPEGARKAGKVRTEGKEYVVKDGDIIEILHAG